jgi:N-acetylglucosaminyl-diphospho-decaprenol L-rhamnosyltransferase
MKLSYVIVTRNRRDALLRTLALLEEQTRIGSSSWEVIIVDNASDDGSPEAVAREHREATIIRLDENEGMPGRNHGFRAAQGKYVCLLDDDSYPTGRAIPMALAHLDRDPKAAAVVGRVVLPSGELEGPALPCVMMGGASVVRKTVLDKTKGFSPEFFRQAEEYDLSFRILRTGLRIERFEDVVFRHDKVAGGRSSALVHRMDLRNNLILVERFLPRHLRRAYRHDWAGRYIALARHDGQANAARTAMHEALVWARRERTVGRQTLDAATLETVFSLDKQCKAVEQWKRLTAVRRVAVADLSKNIYATWRACQAVGLEVAAVADDRSAFAGMVYRGAPVLPLAEVLKKGSIDGVVLSNVNPAQVAARAGQIRASFAGPLLTLWAPRYLESPGQTPGNIEPQAGARAA